MLFFSISAENTLLPVIKTAVLKNIKLINLKYKQIRKSLFLVRQGPCAVSMWTIYETNLDEETIFDVKHKNKISTVSNLPIF